MENNCMDYQKFTGKTISEAITNACNTLKVMSTDIEYKIISEGKKGFFSSEPAIVEVRKKEIAIKNIDTELSDGDHINYYCNKCIKDVTMKIMFSPEGMLGICNNCGKYKIIKKNENYIPKEKIINIPKCPICGSTNINKITISSRAVKTAVFGVVGAVDDAGKTYKCGNCGSKF